MSTPIAGDHVYAIADAAHVRPATVRRVLDGLEVWPRRYEAIAAAARELGVEVPPPAERKPRRPSQVDVDCLIAEAVSGWEAVSRGQMARIEELEAIIVGLRARVSELEVARLTESVEAGRAENVHPALALKVPPVAVEPTPAPPTPLRPRELKTAGSHVTLLLGDERLLG